MEPTSCWSCLRKLSNAVSPLLLRAPTRVNTERETLLYSLGAKKQVKMGGWCGFRLGRWWCTGRGCLPERGSKHPCLLPLSGAPHPCARRGATAVLSNSWLLACSDAAGVDCRLARRCGANGWPSPSCRPLGPHDAIFEIVSVEWAGTARPAPLGNGSPCAAGNGSRCAVAHSEPLPGARLMPTGSVVAVAALASTGSSKQDTLARVPQRVTLAFLPWWSGAPSYQSTFELRRRNQRRAET